MAGQAAVVDRGSFLLPTHRSFLLPVPLLLLVLLFIVEVLSLFPIWFLLLCVSTVFDKPAAEVLKSQARKLLSALIQTGSLKNNSVRLSEASANLILQRCIIQP